MVKEKECKIYLYISLNQTIIFEMMKINLLYHMFKNFAWEWLF